METHPTVCIAAMHGRKVLLVRMLGEPCRGLWAIPGGHIERDEEPQQAAVREAAEEIPDARIVSGPDTIFMHGVPDGEKRHPEPHRHLCHVFHALSGGTVRTGSDAGEGKFFSPEEALALPDLETTGYTQRVLEHLKAAEMHLPHAKAKPVPKA
jgi:8-oxo-dGTP diphosphatase